MAGNVLVKSRKCGINENGGGEEAKKSAAGILK
jgi:hypothetical protein